MLTIGMRSVTKIIRASSVVFAVLLTMSDYAPLNDLVRKHEWYWIPRVLMRSCPCPECGKKGLSYVGYPLIICRFCRSVYKRRALGGGVNEAVCASRRVD